MKRILSSLLAVLALGAYQPAGAQDTTAHATDSARQLAAVSVTAMKPAIIQRADRIIVEIARSPLSAGGDAYEAIKKVPGVTSQQGLRFRGRAVSVYLDGKPIRLSGGDLETYLSSLPAGTIDRIEVLPHPSARYEAAGGAVINIISARSRDYGANGAFTAGGGAGRYGRYNTGLSGNYRNARISAYGSYDLRHTQTLDNSRITRSFNDNYGIFEEQSIRPSTYSHTIKAGFDCVSGRNSFGMGVTGLLTARDRDIVDLSRQHNYRQNLDSLSAVTTVNRSRYLTPTVNVYYKTRVGRGDLSLDADYFGQAKDWQDRLITLYTDAAGKAWRPPYEQRDQSPARNRSGSLSTGYSFHIGETRWETGLKALFTRTDNDITWETLQSGWMVDPARSNRFIYDENIWSAWVSASRSLGKLNLQVGLRTEHTDSRGNSVTLHQRNTQHYTNLFPSLSGDYSFTGGHQLSLSYKRSIERFGFSIVNPFIIYQNQFAWYQGNPHIRPSFSHNLELSWVRGNEWMASLGYSHYIATPAEIYRKDATGNAVIITYENVSSADQLTCSLTWTRSLWKGRLSTSNTLGALHAGYHAPASTGLNNTSYTLSFNSNDQLLLGHGWKAEVNLDYCSPMAIGAYRFRSQLDLGAGLSKSLMTGKATLSLNVTDLLNTAKRRYSAASYGTLAVTDNRAETRFVKLTFVYRFGNTGIKTSRPRRTGLEEIKRRMAD